MSDDDPISFVLQSGPNRAELDALTRQVRRWVLAKINDAQAALTAIRGRLDTLENIPVVTLTVVASPAGLPASAGPRQFFRVQGDPALYIGNGPGQPLTKLVPA